MLATYKLLSYRSMIGPSVCPSECPLLLMHPAKAVGWNEVPFSVVPTNIVFDRGPGTPMRREDLGVGIPSQNLHCTLHANCYR